MINDTYITGVSLALISTASWALCSILFKKLIEKLDPIGMTAATSVIGALFLILVMFFSGSGFQLDKNSLILIASSGVIGICFGDIFYYASLNRLSAIIFSLIMFMGPDLFSGFFGIVFLKEFPPLIVWLGIILTLVGLGFFIFPINKDVRQNSSSTILGVIFAVFSLICTAYSMVLVKPILNNIPIVTITMYRMLFSAAALIIFGFISRKIFVWKKALSDKKFTSKLFGSMVLVTFGGFYFALLALKYSSLVVTSAITSLGPLFVFLFMVAFYKYKPKKREYFGALFILFGIVLICKG